MRARTRLWMAMAAGPVAWFLDLLASFTLTALPCSGRGRLLVLAVTAATGALAVAGGVVGWRERTRRRVVPRADSQAAQSRVLAAVAMVLGAGFLLVILVQSIPKLMIPPCE